MARRCTLTGKGVQSGNMVSHSNRKTRRRFLPNMQNVSFLSDALGHAISLRVTPNTLRTVTKNGGLDNYLLSTSSSKLTLEGVKMKKLIQQTLAAKAA